MDSKLCFGMVVLCLCTFIIGEVQAKEVHGLGSRKTGSKLPDFNAWTEFANPDDILTARSAYFTTNHDFTGFIGSMTVYNHNIRKGQMTRSYISIQSNANEEITAGWVVDPWTFGDSRTRFFAQWKGVGCPNSECRNGFVPKQSAYLAPGDPLDAGNHMTLKFLKDVGTGDWILYAGASINFLSEIGRFPKSLFTQLAVQANHAEFGGSVKFINSLSSPPMGNGVFARNIVPAGQPWPAMMTGLYYVRPDGVFVSINSYSYKLGYLNCYGLGKPTGSDDHFVYGGPGGCFS
ncbi:hypothetical protein LUZ62_025671 [Rhynchospora pubera]|uniref:Neprosin PEP catalytic domain-containing protein n=1 Tax=Rhynchospora pubera TaxID=906938 RepID=A0AAV8HB24_9POAL|nr:hypothetical protein LUZ62_025671 [Rhynchospora pubera]